MHKSGVAHGDLFKGNIALSGGRVKLIDFGWASATNFEYLKYGTSAQPVLSNDDAPTDLDAGSLIIREARILFTGMEKEQEAWEMLQELVKPLAKAEVSAEEAFEYVKDLLIDLMKIEEAPGQAN